MHQSGKPQICWGRRNPQHALKAAIETKPDTFFSMYTRYLQAGLFPDKWRQQRLVLLPKERKPPDETISYRPLCLLDTAGKILEQIIHGRIYISFIGQELAEHKTEALLITGRKVVVTITQRIEQHKITSQPAIRYLGVIIDARFNFEQQVEHAVTKATAVRTVLSRLMLNIGEPKQNKSDIFLPVECPPSGKRIPHGIKRG